MENDDINVVLDNDEHIIYDLKPNKKRFVIISSIAGCLISLIIGVSFFTPGLLGIFGIIEFHNENGGDGIFAAIIFMVVGGFMIINIFSTIIMNLIRYKKTRYVVTEKRLLIRSGVIGADYRSLSLKSIEMINVQVDFLDKIVHPNSGTIYFANNATPVITNQTNRRSNVNTDFSFAHIDDPYNNYKKIKQYIDSVKE